MSAKDERTPLAAAEASTSASGAMRTFGYGLTTVVLSVGLINFNSYLMKEDRFPYAAPLVVMHMGFCSTLALFLRLVYPSLFPALTDPARQVPIDRSFMANGVLPIAAVFAASLVLTNLAYKKLSVAFLQMLKETNIVLVYVFSLMAALEVYSVRHVQVIFFAIAAASLTIKGELHFEMSGFIIQCSSMVCECMRIVLQSVLLSGRKLDPLSYVLVVSPVCFALLGSLMLVLLLLPAGALGPGLEWPPADKMHAYAPLLLANCSLAFALNVSIAVLIKNTSATSYIFCGVLKDIVAVLVSVVVLKESVSTLQFISFSMQICSVVVWSLMKSNPANFEHGIVHGVFLSLGLLPEAPVAGAGLPDRPAAAGKEKV